MPIDTQIIQGEALVSLAAVNVPRTQTQNPESNSGNLGLPEFDEHDLRPGYSGDGYLDLNGGSGDKASFTFDAPAGTYAVTLRVANGATASPVSRLVALRVEGQPETPAQETNTKSWYSWEQRTFEVTVSGDGPHTVTIVQKESQGPNIDAVAVHDVGAPVSFAPPAFATPEAFEVVENGAEVGVVAASDVEGQPVSYAIAGGADAALFAIDGATGALRFKVAPDFEAPGSAADTNAYEVTVSATDGVETTEQAIVVTVADDAGEALPRPAIAPQLVQAEAGALALAKGPQDSTRSFHRLNTDPATAEAPGADKILDAAGLRAGYAGTGYTDFENDAGDTLTVPFAVDEAGIYSLHIRYASQLWQGAPRSLVIAANPGEAGEAGEASLGEVTFPDTGTTSTGANEERGFNNWGVLTVEIALRAGQNTVALSIPAGRTSGPNVDALALTTAGEAANFAAPVFTSPTSFAIEENTTAIGAVAAADLDDDTTDGVAPTVAYAIAGGADADAFAIDAATGALLLKAAADFETKASHAVEISATDAKGATTTQAVTVAVTDVDEAPVDQPATGIALTAIAVPENAPGAVVAEIAVTDPDTAYGAADFAVSDARFRVVEEEGALKLALAEGVALDFEGEIPGVTVSGGGVTSAPFTPTVTDVAEGGPVAVRFDAAAIAPYSTQDKPAQGGAGAVVGEDGAALTLDGNLWKRVALAQDYTITEATRLELTLSLGAATPEIVALGFDADEDPFNANGALFQLAGTQRNASFTDLRGTGEGGRFAVDLSAHAGRTLSSLIFLSDDDLAGNGLGSATFAEVVFVEAAPASGNAAPRVVGGGVSDLVLPEGERIEIDLPFVDDDGDALAYGFEVRDAAGALVAVEGLAIEDGVLSGPAPAAPGAYTITLRASDGEAEASDRFAITVENVNDAPVAGDPALEPVVATAGRPIDSIDLADFAPFFTDPDGDALTLTVEGLPAGLSLNEEGVIVGTPTGGGAVTARIRATDPDGLSATLDLLFQIGGGAVGDATVVEAESFTGLGAATNFQATAQAGASDSRIIRAVNTSGPSAVTTDLSQNGVVEGWYRVSMTRYDETDGSATFSLSVGDAVLAEDVPFDAAGSFDNAKARGGAGQAGNLKTVEFDTPVFVTAGTILTLSGQANGELLRTDKFTFTRVEAPNAAPSAPTLDASVVAENDAGAEVGALEATDPEGEAIAFSTADARFEVVDGRLKLREGVSLDFEAGATVEVEVTATDASGSATTATLTVTVTDVAEAPLAPTLSGEPVAENVPGAIAGTLSATSPEGRAVTFTTDDPRFEVVEGQLKLRDEVALDFEEAGSVAVSVTADDGVSQTTGEVTVVVADANDAPTLAAGAAIADVAVAAGAGATVPLAALEAADQDAGDTLALVAQGADGAALPEGFAVVDGALVVPASAPAGAYEVEVFATDGEARSESVRFTVTVGEPAPFAPVVVQAEEGAIALAQAPDANSTQVRDAENRETNPDLADGLRPGFSGTGYLDFGNDAGDTASYTVTVPVAGEYDLSVRYATNTARPLDLAINGVKATAPLAFAATDPDGAGPEEGFDHWAFETRTVTLGAGENTIALSIPAGATTGPNLDRIEITEAGTGPIPAPDTSADEGGDLAATAPASVAEGALGAVEVRLSGVDADIEAFEVSLDNGETFQPVTATQAGADWVVTLDLSGAAGSASAEVVLRVTDEAGNTANASAIVAIADEATPPFRFEQQMEARDGSVTILDDTGGGTNNILQTQPRDPLNPETPDPLRGPDNLWDDFTGAGYLDMGGNIGDAAAFTVEAPEAGAYEVTIRYANGNAAAGGRPMTLSVGDAVVETIPFLTTTAWDNWREVTVSVTLAAGANTLTLANTIANGPNIDRVVVTRGAGGPVDPEPVEAERLDTVIRVNFEPAVGGAFGAPSGYATPEGFEADRGEAFGARAGGFSYGWLDLAGNPAAQPSGSMRYKNDVPAASDLQKTYAHFEYPGAPEATRERVWEMAVENGTYEVTASVGDTGGPFDSSYVLRAEGRQINQTFTPQALDGTSPTGSAYSGAVSSGVIAEGEGFRSDLVTAIVTVTDGRLTLDSVGGQNTEIQWLEIREVADLTPGDARPAEADYARFIQPVAVAGVGGDRLEVDLEMTGGEPPVGVRPDSDLTLGLGVVTGRGEGDVGRAGISFESLGDGSIRLFETLTGQEVAFSANTSGGNDTVTISPSADLKENTSYTLVIDGALDLGENGDAQAARREFQTFTTTFVTGEAPEIEAAEVAFAETVEVDGAADGLFGVGSITMSPDGQHLYATTLGGSLLRFEVEADGSLGAREEIALTNPGYFQNPEATALNSGGFQVGPGRGIIGIAFDPNDPDTIWVTDNYPVPLTGRNSAVPEFSARLSRIKLDGSGEFSGTAEAYAVGFTRSNGDHLTNSIVFRENESGSGPSHYLYLSQGANTAIGGVDPGWGSRPERLLSAAVLEIDTTRDVSNGPIDVSTEPLPDDNQNRRFTFAANPAVRDYDEDWREGPIPIPASHYEPSDAGFPLNGKWLHYDARGVATVRETADPASAVVQRFYDPFAQDAPVKLYATGVRNAYDVVSHSNGKLYLPSNGTAAGGVLPDDPSTARDERIGNVSKQDDYLFVLKEGGYYGSPNPIRGEYIAYAGNPTAGQTPGSLEVEQEGGNQGYPVGTQPDPRFDAENSFSLSENRSPNGAVEYEGNAFGASLKGYLLITEYSQGDDIVAVPIGPDGRPDVANRFTLKTPEGRTLSWTDPLDIAEGPNGVLYVSTLNRDTGASQIIRLDPRPGGAVTDTTADQGGDLAIAAVDVSDPAAVVFAVTGLDADIETVRVSFDGGATSQAVTLDAQGRFTADLSGRTGAVSATLTVRDDAGNTASKATAFTLGGGGGAPGDAVTIDATAFTLLGTGTGTAATLVRRIDEPATHEPTGTNDLDGDGLNDGYDGLGYLDPNGGAEDKASFTVTVAEAGTYSVALRMANGGASGGTAQPRPIAVKLGDQVVTIADTHTGDFKAWRDFPVTLTLEAGANTVVIAQTTAGGAPNIDSVRITPLEVADTTADAGGDLALSVVDATDPSQAVFAVSGLDADIETLSVSVGGGAAQAVTLNAQGRFTLDLGAASGEVALALVVTDEAGNTATASAAVSLDDPAAPNDGETVVGGVAYVFYEAENANLGGAAVVPETADDRGASGAGFVDFVGTADQTVTWTVTVAESGPYALDILYALASTKAARPMTLSVDGQAVATLPFAPNSNAAETVWGPQPATVTLSAGTHAIAVTAPGGNGPNLDLLRITKGTVEVFDPTYAALDGETRLELEATDGTTRTVSDAEVEFYVAPVEGGVYALDLAANAGAPDGGAVTVLLDGVAVAADDFPEGGEETVFLTLEAGARHRITIRSDGPGASSLDYIDLRSAPGNPNADIAIESQDPAFFPNRLHFSFLENPDAVVPGTARSFKDSGVVTISNTGTEPLEFRDAAITGPFRLADPDAFEGLTLAAGASVEVEVLFDAAAIVPKPSNGQNGVREGTLRLSTNDADTPVAEVDLAGFWQARDEGGWEPNVNEVWQIFGFGNRIEGLALTGGGENSTLSTNDVFDRTDETEVLSPYWRIADDASEARITQIAAFHGPGGATLGIHGPGNKSNGNDDLFWDHAGTHNQRLLPLVGGNGGDGGVGAASGGFATATFTRANIPGGWAGNGLFGIEVAGLSTDPRLNPTGGVIVPGAQQGHTVKVFQALDADGVAIAGTFLVAMDYTGINYDYNDNLFVVEGVAPVGFGESLSLSGLDSAAADDRLVFTNINNPANASQAFRNEATFTLTNDGLGPLAVEGVTIGGADAGSFEIVGAAPMSIAAGASAKVTVRYVGVDPTDDNKAVLHEAALTVETSAGAREVALAGLAQIQSESGEEPTVAQIVEALGYGTDVAQGALANGGQVETVGDEALLPYLAALDGSKPVEVIQLAAFLNQGNVARLSAHGLDAATLTELFAADDNQGQTVLPDGLVPGAGDTGGVARAAFSPDGPFGLKVTVDGRPTYASWTDPAINRIDPDFGQLVGDDQGHLIRFFQAKDAQGRVIEGTYIGIQDYPGAGNYDYNDHMFLVRNVQAHALTAAEDANGDGVLDALQTDADGDGTVAFFDGDDAPATPVTQNAFNANGTPWAVGAEGLTLQASQFDTGGQGVAYNDDGAKSGDGAVRPGTNVDISFNTGAVGYTAAGEWLEYTIDVPEAGEYTLFFNSSSPIAGRTLTASFEKDGAFYEAATAAVPNTGAYTTYADTAPVTVTLEAGVQVLRVNFDLNQQDLKSFTLKPVAAPTNAAPVAEAIGGVPAGTEDAPFSFDVSGFFSDPDGDALSYTLAGAPAGLSISPSGVITGTPTADGTFAVTVTASDGSLAASAPFALTVAPAAPAPAGQQPFPGPDAPAFSGGALTVDASNYDAGGQGVAYNDAAGLQGGSNGGRAGSDVEQTAAGDIGWINTGEWLEYTIDVPQAGLYDLDLLLALGGGSGRTATVTFTAAGASQPYATTGPIANPSTGGWTSFQTRSADGIALEAGEQVVRVAFAGGAQDFRSFTLTQVAPTNQAPVAGTLAAAAAEENEPFALDLSGAFSDPDGDALAFSAEGLPEGLGISPSGVVSGTPTEDGAYAVTVTASDGALSTSASFTLSVAAEPPAAPAQAPFPGPNAPGFTGGTLSLAATAYDQGGQGVAYNDVAGLQGGTTGGRAGSDVEVTGGGAVGWIEPGEWLEYTIAVPQAGLYDVDLLLATPLGGRSASVEVFLPGASTPYASSGSIANPSTGSYTNFQPRSVEGMALQAGVQVVRVTFEGGSQDFQGLTLTQQPTGPAQTPFPGPDAPVLADALTVLAKDFDQGGQGVSWNDDAGLDGGAQPQRGDTDVELVGSALDIGYVEAGEWVEYTIDVAEAGAYDLSLIAKTPIGGNGVTVSLDGGPALAAFALPDSNGSSTGFGGTSFAPTAAQTVTLDAGLQTLRLAFDGTPASNGYLLDLRSFTLEASEGAPQGAAPTAEPPASEPPAPGAIGEAGVVTVAQASAGQWFSVRFAEALEDAAVVMGPILSDDADPATVRVRNVTSEGFEFQLDEWNHLDGVHGPATVSWMAVESGVHSVGGLALAAGVGQASQGASTVGFATSFGSAPVVAAQVTSTNDPDAATDRIDGVTATGFKVSLDDEEANKGFHGAESLAWIAMAPGGSAEGGLLAGKTENAVTQKPFTQSFGGSFGDEFAFLADMQTEDGTDPATVRLASLSASGATLLVEEERSKDLEINHTTEDLGFIGIKTGLLFADDLLG